MGIAYVKTSQARQLHCPCSFFCGSQQRLAISFAEEGGLPPIAGRGQFPWSLPAPLPHPTIPQPLSQDISTELCRALPSSGPFIPLLAEFLFSFESVAFPVLCVLAQKHSASSKLCNNNDLTICWC